MICGGWNQKWISEEAARDEKSFDDDKLNKGDRPQR